MHSMLPGEICPQAARSLVWQITFSAGWGLTFLDTLLYPPLSATIGAYATLPYPIAAFIVFVLLFRYMPETKGKTVKNS